MSSRAESRDLHQLSFRAEPSGAAEKSVKVRQISPLRTSSSGRNDKIGQFSRQKGFYKIYQCHVLAHGAGIFVPDREQENNISFRV